MTRFLFLAVLLVSVPFFSNAKLSKHSRRPAQVECPTTRPRTTMLKTKAGTEFPVSVVSPCEVESYFAEVAAAPNIPYAYPEDGCYARAHAISKILDRKNITTGKIFVEGDLRVETKNSPKGYVEWNYHVAPVIAVDYNGTQSVAVLDPSIFTHAVTVEEWLDIQTRHKGASRQAIFQTNRFHYVPSEQDEELNEYKPDDIHDMEVTLKHYMRVLASRRTSTQTTLAWPSQWENH